ncbi:MAG: hypothetical protein WBL27_01745 [Salinimicrobium sp.]
MKIVIRNRHRREDTILKRIKEQEKLQFMDSPQLVNSLEKQGFIKSSGNNQYYLTEKGKQAHQLGMKNYRECERIEQEILRFTIEKAKKEE